jgi:hypothetical protein
MAWDQTGKRGLEEGEGPSLYEATELWSSRRPPERSSDAEPPPAAKERQNEKQRMAFLLPNSFCCLSETAA